MKKSLQDQSPVIAIDFLESLIKIRNEDNLFVFFVKISFF